ncbi:hypothetical protein [Frigoribacterium sp. CFBP 8751]|uniref:hypothetical protein n=1 Tax=Frigoribacterium sp. CFBP 8751 TaxID=2775277 RepID=UPI001786D665|nr:hypothetical protein [Frigoribacterium sp. CFBP 8751]MBD8539165.1 hypothetical protein [Frigoribacterium sp. CFBP 8751]
MSINRDRPYSGSSRYHAGPGSPADPSGNLNAVSPVIDSDGGYDWTDAHRSAKGAEVTAYFGDLKEALIDFIDASEALAGCVAWLTDFDILDALAAKPVALVVQKEDFLRPDAGSGSDWPRRLRAKYDSLQGGFDRFEFPSPLWSASSSIDPSIDPIRCVGNHNFDKRPAMPRMHHKFLVRITPRTLPGGEYELVDPTAVWTGSFNFSLNGGRSMENAVVLEDKSIAEAYLAEFARVETLSEVLDWESPWTYPEWRIGT